MRDRESLGWEARQGWLEAHYWLATLYQRCREKEEALAWIDRLLTLWKQAAPELPLLKASIRLRKELGG